MFRNQLLAKGLVEKLEVSNKSLVKVYVRTSAPASADNDGSLRSGTGAAGGGAKAPGQPQSVYKYLLHVGSVDSFERKMEEAQEALGISLGEEVGSLLTSPWLPGSPSLYNFLHLGCSCKQSKSIFTTKRMCGCGCNAMRFLSSFT